MNAVDVASKLCSDLILGVAVHDDQSYIVTRFTYPDGDTINLYFDTLGGNPRVNDMGTTIFKIIEMGIAITPNRTDLIRAICDLQGVEFDKSNLVFRKALKSDSPGVGCLAFCEAITRISNIQYETSARARSSFKESLDRVIIDRIEVPQVCTVVRDWTNPAIDPAGKFPVDYMFNGAFPPRLLFGVNSTSKALDVVETYAYFLKNNRRDQMLAVLDDDEALASDARQRLDQLLPVLVGVENNEDKITNFAARGEL